MLARAMDASAGLRALNRGMVVFDLCVAAARGEPRDWWALAWLRATEIATDALWSRSPALSRPGARAGLWLAGAGNVVMALGFARLSRR